MQILIRAQQCDDSAVVHAINVAAFGQPAEADLVNALRTEASPHVSLVAADGENIVGHIMFSPVTLPGSPDLKIAGLAPMSVMPAHQRSGIGSLLVHAGLEQCRQLGFWVVVVLGHPGYYPKFGFLPSVQFAIDSEYDVPAELFMALELEPNALDGHTGTVKYHSAFGQL